MSHFPRSLPSTARRLRLGENPATGMQGGNRSSSPTISHASFHRLCASPVSALPFAVAAPRRPPPPDKTGKMSKQRGLLNNSVVRRACLIRGDRRASQMGRECVHRMGGKY
uniref:Uncharacterized protein n=1 Tax=Oryza meridionalis TaxID=40149 RepID=A0A0E0CKK0_9ORYZ